MAFNALAALCTINEGDPYVAVVQSAYLTRHVGGAVHMLVCVCVCVCVCV